VRFMVDECAGQAVAAWLQRQGHGVFSVFEEARGASDAELIAKAHAGRWILVTADKDFGERIFRERQPHCGVVLLRLEDQRAARKIAVLARLLENHGERLPGHFLVVTETHVRFARC